MRLAEHLAVVLGCFAAATPGSHVIGIHFGLLPNLRAVGIVAEGGRKGGEVVVCGTPDDVRRSEKGYTSRYL